jgi:hypothetical protein
MLTHEDEARAKARAEMKILANNETNTKKIFLYNCLRWKTYEEREFHIPEEGELCIEPRRLFQHLCSGLLAPQANVVEFKTYHTTSTRKIMHPAFNVFKILDGRRYYYVSAERQVKGVVVQLSSNETFVLNKLSGVPRCDAKDLHLQCTKKVRLSLEQLIRILTEEDFLDKPYSLLTNNSQQFVQKLNHLVSIANK